LSGVVAGTETAQQYENVAVPVFSDTARQFGNNFLDVPANALEPSKKKMSSAQKTHLHKIVGYKPPRLTTGKSCWYIGFSAFDPIVGLLRQKRIKLNHINPISTRRLYANELIKRISEKLIDGWSPWIEDENSNAYKEFSEVCDHYRLLLSRELSSGVIRPETYSSYTSYIKNVEAYNIEKGKIKYIYQFDRLFLLKFLEYIYIDRKNTAQTRDNYLGFLRLFSTFLVEQQYCKIKPTEGIATLGRRAKKKQRTIIPEEVRIKISNYLQNNNKDMYLASCVLYYCFIRPKEMSRLKIEHINLANYTILIPDEVSKNKTTAIITIPQPLYELFVEMEIDKYPKYWHLFSDRCKPGKTFRSEKQFRDYWNNHLRKDLPDLKQNPAYKFYSLKDTGITDLLRNNVDVISVRDQARHHSILITDTYTPHDIQQANDIIKLNTKKF
jgi:integrase